MEWSLLSVALEQWFSDTTSYLDNPLLALPRHSHPPPVPSTAPKTDLTGLGHAC